MRKALVVITMAGIAATAMAGYITKTISIPAGTLSASLTNDTFKSTWVIEDVYVYGSTGAATTDVATVTKLVGTIPVVIDSVAIVSNSTAFYIDMGGVLPLVKNEACTLNRTAASTNQAVTAIVAINEITL